MINSCHSYNYLYIRPQTIPQALKQNDSEAYPNLSALLKIAGTVAVRSCECKRSGSVLKRLNTREINWNYADAYQL